MGFEIKIWDNRNQNLLTLFEMNSENISLFDQKSNILL
jgi:hypothetical protein